MYQYDQYRPDHRRRTRRAIPRPGSPPFVGRVDAKKSSGRCVCRTACICSATPTCSHRDSVRQSAQRPDAHARADRARTRPRLRPLFDAHQHPVQLDRARRDPGNPAQAGSRCKCTASRPRAIASATSPPTSSRAWRPTKSSIRVRRPKSCVNGRRSTLNSRGCRASSRSRCPARWKIAPPCRFTISASI